jgi:hypothetical protein
MKITPPIDFTGIDAINWSESHADAAADALLILAQYLRRGEAVPSELAKYLADAIEASMEKPSKARGKAFTDELHLTANNRRPVGYWLEIGQAIEELISNGHSNEIAKAKIVEKYGISEKTAANYLDRYREAINETQRIEDAER